MIQRCRGVCRGVGDVDGEAEWIVRRKNSQARLIMRFIFKTDYLQDIRLFQHGGNWFWYGLLLLILLIAPWMASNYVASCASLDIAVAGNAIHIRRAQFGNRVSRPRRKSDRLARFAALSRYACGRFALWRAQSRRARPRSRFSRNYY